MLVLRLNEDSLILQNIPSSPCSYIGDVSLYTFWQCVVMGHWELYFRALLESFYISLWFYNTVTFAGAQCSELDNNPRGKCTFHCDVFVNFVFSSLMLGRSRPQLLYTGTSSHLSRMLIALLQRMRCYYEGSTLGQERVAANDPRFFDKLFGKGHRGDCS